ncbi:Bestrophin, RFP-TM, chloride channel-domain-containing protein [Mycena leptocephala]|nr:Bestrophin, RFP-TM, chloride channel-domain-containing protein [Mycena leptocephala]
MGPADGIRFAPRRRPGASFFNALLATALFRCWHILLFFAAWSTTITILDRHHFKVRFASTLLTVVGTVLGFVVSYRTTSSFERYNEGRRYDMAATKELDAETLKSRGMVEKKTVINLIEAFSVAVKHYLRGEDGIYYQDLYYLVKFLPAYALPAGIPSNADLTNGADAEGGRSPLGRLSDASTQFRPSLGQPGSFLYQRQASGNSVILARADEAFLLPGSLPPKYHLFDLFPFSLLVKCLTKRGAELKGKKAARLRAKMASSVGSHNLPLEISLYLSSYIASLQQRKQTDVPTTNNLLGSLNNLVDALTGLERILTTPIPFSYSIHLWLVTTLYCLALPSQIVSTMNWLTIPATILLTFIFFGFLVAGEEIENPFGYDKNDLNLDHFTHNIIRNELRAITSSAPPLPDRWIFSPENDMLFATDVERDERVGPNEWVRRGSTQMLHSLSVV